MGSQNPQSNPPSSFSPVKKLQERFVANATPSSFFASVEILTVYWVSPFKSELGVNISVVLSHSNTPPTCGDIENAFSVAVLSISSLNVTSIVASRGTPEPVGLIPSCLT